jgi:hypothetical protein
LKICLSSSISSFPLSIHQLLKFQSTCNPSPGGKGGSWLTSWAGFFSPPCYLTKNAISYPFQYILWHRVWREVKF